MALVKVILKFMLSNKKARFTLVLIKIQSNNSKHVHSVHYVPDSVQRVFHLLHSLIQLALINDRML